ncbi:FIST N-terminal domain-containing protein [Sorangium sp. So ce1128]
MIEATTVSIVHDDAREAGRLAALELLDRLRRSPDLVILFVPASLDGKQVLEGLWSRLPAGTQLAGCSAAGEINSEELLSGSITAMGLCSQDVEFRTFKVEGVGPARRPGALPPARAGGAQDRLLLLRRDLPRRRAVAVPRGDFHRGAAASLIMPCEHCPLERAEGAPPVPLATFLDRLTTCDGCPRLAAEEATPLVRLLADRHREAARAIRGLENEIRKLKRELKEAASAADEYEGRLATLEQFQKRSSQEVEEELRAQLDLVRQQGAEMQAMSTPIIRVWEGVLVLPIIGSVDSARAASMMERIKLLPGRFAAQAFHDEHECSIDSPLRARVRGGIRGELRRSTATQRR